MVGWSRNCQFSISVGQFSPLPGWSWVILGSILGIPWVLPTCHRHPHSSGWVSAPCRWWALTAHGPWQDFWRSQMNVHRGKWCRGLIHIHIQLDSSPETETARLNILEVAIASNNGAFNTQTQIRTEVRDCTALRTWRDHQLLVLLLPFDAASRHEFIQVSATGK